MVVVPSTFLEGDVEISSAWLRDSRSGKVGHQTTKKTVADLISVFSFEICSSDQDTLDSSHTIIIMMLAGQLFRAQSASDQVHIHVNIKML